MFNFGTGGGGAGGSGDVTGPASSTDNAIARFDGAGGKTLQNSVVTVADTTGDLAFPSDATIQTGAGNTSLNLRTEGTGGVTFSNGTNLQATMDPSGSLVQAGANGYKCIGVVGADGATPAFIPDKADPNTGFAHGPSADQASVAAGGIEVIRANTVASGINHLEVTPGASGNPVLVQSTSIAGTGGISVIAAAPPATTGASVAGKSLTLTASDAVASTDTAGAAAGGSIIVQAGAAKRFTSGNANGGNIQLVGGGGIGTGTTGIVIAPSGTAASPGIQGITGAEFHLGNTDSNAMQLCANGAKKFAINAVGLVDSSGNGGTASINAGSTTIPYAFTSNTTTGLALHATGQVALRGAGVNTAIATATGFRARTEVLPKAASPVTVAVDEVRSVYTNEGAGGAITFNLPTAVAGYDYTFVVQATQNMVVTASAGDTIRVAAGVSSAGGTATNGTIGSTLRIVSINATEWIAVGAPNGTWSLA